METQALSGVGFVSKGSRPVVLRLIICDSFQPNIECTEGTESRHGEGMNLPSFLFLWAREGSG